jgi:hypothetical protein
MARKRIAEGSRFPVAFQVMTLANSTAIAVDSTVRAAGAHLLLISVETQPARMRADGTDPTLTTGVIFEKDVLHEFTGYDQTSQMKFQRTTGTATVSIMAYKYD